MTTEANAEPIRDGDYQVTAPYFVALVCIRDGRVADAAPILKWTVGKSAKYVFAWFRNREFDWHRLNVS